MHKFCKIITNYKQLLKEILKCIECCIILRNMLNEFGDVSPDNFHEEYPTDIDGPA